MPFQILQNMNDSIWKNVYKVNTYQIWTYGKFGGWVANCVEPIKYNNDLAYFKKSSLALFYALGIAHLKRL